jgi:hypothetical protein
MGGGPTWSYLQLALGRLSVDASLAPTFDSTENFRTRLADWWNVVGITSSGNATGWGPDGVGLPYVTSHYGFLLPNLYLLTALSGQQGDIYRGALSFDPRLPAPFSLPVSLPGVLGTLAVDAAGRHNLSVAFGTLSLVSGGLRVGAAVYAGGAVTLGPGQWVAW